jgi:hypothetical protein
MPEHCGRPMTSVELPGVYDGTCFWLCDVCGRWMHRFDRGDRRRAKAEVVGKLCPGKEITPERP